MTDTYILAIPVSDLFVDRTYQRELDAPRARSMARHWDRRMVGALDVSDRGDTDTPARYAVINGQHRMEAARIVDPDMPLVCTVHTGLSVADEAQLFWDIDRETRSLTTWDRWYARRAAGDPTVLLIDEIAKRFDLVVTERPGDTSLQCCASLEWALNRCGADVVDQTLELLTDVWPTDSDGTKGLIVKAIATTLYEFGADLDTGRLADALSDITPNNLIARGHDLKASGHTQSMWKLVAIATRRLYNRRPGDGPKLAAHA